MRIDTVVGTLLKSDGTLDTFEKDCLRLGFRKEDITITKVSEDVYWGTAVKR